MAKAKEETVDFDTWAADVTGRLDVIERTLGIGQIGGDPTKDNNGKKIGAGEDDPASPESDKKAGKV